jgi:hypothetical protein
VVVYVFLEPSMAVDEANSVGKLEWKLGSLSPAAAIAALTLFLVVVVAFSRGDHRKLQP